MTYSAGYKQTYSLPGGASMEFVWIPQGKFQMGSPNPEDGHEWPKHDVTISSGFWLSKYVITQGQWESVMGKADWAAANYITPWAGRDYVKIGSDHPAVCISWYNVQAFIRQLNWAGSAVYRLPSEAEWEYACRAGTSTRWSFGNAKNLLRDYAWYDDNARHVGNVCAHAVGQKLPNPWGLYDMHGNVWEWVQDLWGKAYYDSSPRVDPQGSDAGGDGYVVRGGDFYNVAEYARSAYRRSHPSTNRVTWVGARLLRSG